MGDTQPRYPEHPWREYAGPATNHCRRCGASISQTIQLCDSCKRRYNVWFSDAGYLRAVEEYSLEMGQIPKAKTWKVIYA